MTSSREPNQPTPGPPAGTEDPGVDPAVPDTGAQRPAPDTVTAPADRDPRAVVLDHAVLSQ